MLVRRLYPWVPELQQACDCQPPLLLLWLLLLLLLVWLLMQLLWRSHMITRIHQAVGSRCAILVSACCFQSSQLWIQENI